MSDVEEAARYGRPTEELQAWAYATLQLAGGWSIFGGLRYDFEQDMSNYETVGLEFNCECFDFKIAYVSNDNEDEGDLDKLLTIDVTRWKQEMGYREEHLSGFTNVPEAIWEAHRRVASALDQS